MPLTTFLDGRSYTTLRGLAAFALSDTGHVQNRVSTDNAGGGGTSTFTNASTVACRVYPISEMEQASADRTADRSTHRILVPPGEAASRDGRFAIDNRGTFTVVAVRERTSEFISEMAAVEL